MACIADLKTVSCSGEALWNEIYQGYNIEARSTVEPDEICLDPCGMRILSLSDIVVPFVYSRQVRERFADVDLIIGCGDLPYYYLEFVVSLLDVPLYFVRGNHDKLAEYSIEGVRSAPMGGANLHRRVMRDQSLLLAGVEGCLRYRDGPYQYSQTEMWVHVSSLIPGLLYNKSRYGRYLDVFVTHAPPQGIHDREDLPHQGIQAFRWLIERFQPEICFHGHTHIYRPDSAVVTRVGKTQVINTYGYRETILESESIDGQT